MAHQDRGPRKPVLRVEILDDENGGSEAFEERDDGFVEGVKATFERRGLRGGDDAGVEETKSRGSRFEDAVTGLAEARVDPDDPEPRAPVRRRRWSP
jgi:hypothetical protein